MPKRSAGTRLTSEGLWDWNLVTNRIHFSPRWLSLIGCDAHDVGHTPDGWLQRIHPEDRDQVAQALDAARNEGLGEFEAPHRLRHKNGTYRWMSCRGLVERDSAGRAIRLTGWHADVTAEEATDSVTGLPNRKLLLDRLAHSIERSQHHPGFRFALLLVDLGRSMSNAGPARIDAGLLTAAARRLETSLRAPEGDLAVSYNDLVARIHDDQFAVLLDGLKDAGHAKVIGDRLLNEMLAPFSLNGGQVFVAASVGIAVSASAYGHAEDMIRDAETALHRARTLGGSRTEIFDTAILRSEQAEERLEIELTDALQRGEFQLYYQPIVALATNQVVGFEALVRWHHPTRGLLTPLDFIPLAEKTGFIIPLGRWILYEACHRLKQWQDRYAPGCWMSVNLSGAQLKNPTLVDEIGEVLEETGLDSGSLALELTESIAMENPIAIKSLLMRLRALGARISVDDFGTGYSSLAHLRQFPVDTLKIDRAFIRGTGADADTSAILATMMAMAQQLGLHVVVEGVENEGQLAMLRELKCEAVQGYLFAKALDAESAEHVLKNGLATPADVGAVKFDLPAMMGKAGRKQWVAGAATLAVLMTSGFALITHDFDQASRPASSAREAAVAPPPLDTAKNIDSAVTSSLPDAKSVAVSPPATPGPVRGSGPLSRTPPLPSETQPAVELKPVSLRVVHLHQFGNCEGRLTISREGMAFVPDERAKDAFTLGHGDFMQSVDGDTMTVKSVAKTYKFKAEPRGKDDKNDNGAALRSFAGVIPRFRQASATF